MEQIIFLLAATTVISVIWALYTKSENNTLINKIDILEKEHRSLGNTVAKLSNENNRLEQVLRKPQYDESVMLRSTREELSLRTKELATAVENMDKLTNALGLGDYVHETKHPFQVKVGISEISIPDIQESIDTESIYASAGLNKDTEIAFFINTDHELCVSGLATEQETDSVLTYFNRIGVRTI